MNVFLVLSQCVITKRKVDGQPVDPHGRDMTIALLLHVAKVVLCRIGQHHEYKLANHQILPWFLAFYAATAPQYCTAFLNL